jgi:outer membrane receptor protein involved in Fe transport
LFRISRIAACLAVLAYAHPVHAQGPGAVEGTVTLASSGAPLAGVTVRANDGPGAATDARGRFRIAALAPGEYRVTARRVGLADAELSVRVAPGATARADFALAEARVVLASVVVSATREVRRLGQTPASVGVVSSAELREARPTHPSEIMQRIPGVWVSATGGEGHTTSIRQPKTTNPVYLYLEDGIPTRSTGFFNHNALYEINVPQAERVEVIKGPATALYGSDAIGGVIDVETRAPSARNGAEAYVEGGDFGWGRVLASATTRGVRDGVRADVNLTRSSGWRESTGYDRRSGTVRWDHLFGSASLKTVLAVSSIDQETAGASTLMAADFDHDPTRNYTPISFRKVRALRLSSAFERPGRGSLFSVTPFVRWNEMEILPDWSLTYDPTLYTTGHRSLGVVARYRRELEPLRTRLIVGTDVDYSPGFRQENRVIAATGGAADPVYHSYTLGARTYEYDVTFIGVSPYLQAEIAAAPRLNVTAGVRFDRIGYRYDNRLTAVDTGAYRRPADADVDFSHLSPKLGATYEASRAANLFVSYAHGFRAPSEGQLFRAGRSAGTLGLLPNRADSYEAGVRGEIARRFGYTLAVYRMDVRDDVLTLVNTADNTRETVNAGHTLHRGVEVGVGAELGSGLRADVSVSRAKHRYEEWSPRTGVDFAGKEMESAPRDLWSARLHYAPAWLRAAHVTGEWQRVGSYWMDADNTHRYDGHTLLSLSAGVPVSRMLEATVRVNNLANEHYAENASYTSAQRGPEYAPGLPRSVYAGLQLRIGR